MWPVTLQPTSVRALQARLAEQLTKPELQLLWLLHLHALLRMLWTAQRKLCADTYSLEERICKVHLPYPTVRPYTKSGDDRGGIVVASRRRLLQHLKGAHPVFHIGRRLTVLEVANVAQHVESKPSAREQHDHPIHELHKRRARVLVHH